MDRRAIPVGVVGSQAVGGEQRGNQQRPPKQRRVMFSGGYAGQGAQELRETLEARDLQIIALNKTVEELKFNFDRVAHNCEVYREETEELKEAVGISSANHAVLQTAFDRQRVLRQEELRSFCSMLAVLQSQVDGAL
jgi:DNA-binding Xre family transcriptional regulator